MKLLIKNGHVIDPANRVNGICDLLIENGKIIKTAADITDSADEVLDASGKIVAPGLVDMHVHFRDPGLEYKEDLITGTKAAAAGGVTSAACMPNTVPVTDNAPVVEYIINKANKAGYANVFPIASISKGMQGKELSEMGDLAEAGAVAVSDDGRPVENAGLMRRAIQYAGMFGLPVISHCEEMSLTNEGSMNEGAVSASLGLVGISRAAEEVMASRDILIAEAVGGAVHIAHVSTRGSVELVRQAKKRGVRVTCETCPHYFSLTDEAVMGFDTNAKMNPPLRTADDVEAIRQGLADGTIDAIVTDHAPHHVDDKSCEFALAANGIVGLETSLGLGIKCLVDTGVLSLEQLIEHMTVIPARILGIDRGTLSEGAPADAVIFDPDKEWIVDVNQFYSKGKNSPYNGWVLKGKPEYTITNGKVVVRNGAVVE